MTLEDYKKNKNGKNKKQKYISNLLTRTLVTVIFVFSVMILVNFNKDLKGTINKYLFKTNHNFSIFNKVYDKYFSSIVNKGEKSIAVFENKDKDEEQKNDYIKYKDGVKKDIGKNEEISLLKSGIVVFVGEKEGYGKTVIVQQSNGTDAWYGNMGNVNVKLYDYIEKGKVIGTASVKLYLVFQKDGKFVDYNTEINATN